MDAFRNCAVTLCLAIAFGSCGDGPTDWKEDVRLMDGTIISVRRHQEYSFCGEIGATSSRCPRDYWLEFSDHRGRDIRWEQKEFHLGTVALIYMSDADVYLLTSPLLTQAHRYYGCPDPAYILWKLNVQMMYGGKYSYWYRVPLEQLPLKKLEANMTFDASDKLEKKINTDDFALYYNGNRWVISLKDFHQQTFDVRNCGRAANMLIEKSSSP